MVKQAAPCIDEGPEQSIRVLTEHILQHTQHAREVVDLLSAANRLQDQSIANTERSMGVEVAHRCRKCRRELAAFMSAMHSECLIHRYVLLFARLAEDHVADS